MTERQFNELRPYVEAENQCIDRGYTPSAGIIRQGWVREIVAGCWQITPEGKDAWMSSLHGHPGLR